MPKVKILKVKMSKTEVNTSQHLLLRKLKKNSYIPVKSLHIFTLTLTTRPHPHTHSQHHSNPHPHPQDLCPSSSKTTVLPIFYFLHF